MKNVIMFLCAGLLLAPNVRAQASGGILSGTPIGSSPWHGLEGGDKFKAFDGDTNTAFDSEDAFIFVGLDLGTAKPISRIRFFPRGTLAARMNGGRIRGANNADLSDAVTLYTIPSPPPEGVWQDVTLPAPSAPYRYVFFTTNADGYGNVAELQFYTVAQTDQAPPLAGRLTGSPIGTTPYHGLDTYDKFKAFDGDVSTIFDSEDNFIYVGLDFGSAKNVDHIRFFPREAWASRMLNGQFRVANAADLSDAVTLYTITSVPPQGVWQDIPVTPPSGTGYRYFFFTTPLEGHGNIAELEAYGTAASSPPSSGTTTSGIYTDTVTGNVGIGTTNPNGYKLAVNGAIHAKEVVIESDPSLWPDYVFAENHSLMSLDAVEAHIKEHKHLPGVPSAQEVSEKGFGVAQMQAAVLEKVEELTLHVIEQEKRIKRLEAENAALRAAHPAP